MKLIFLYGPPASGKHTIGRALAEKTGYKFFHNHLTIDLLKTVLEWGSPGFFELSQKIRLDILEEAAKEKVPGVIFTYVYEKDEDDDFIKKLQERISKHGGEIIFIQIYCEKDELLKRVTNDSRKQFHKVKNPESLGRELEKRDVVSPISIVKSLKIDNTHLSEDETFQKVFELIK